MTHTIHFPHLPAAPRQTRFLAAAAVLAVGAASFTFIHVADRHTATATAPVATQAPALTADSDELGKALSVTYPTRVG